MVRSVAVTVSKTVPRKEPRREARVRARETAEAMMMVAAVAAVASSYCGQKKCFTARCS